MCTVYMYITSLGAAHGPHSQTGGTVHHCLLAAERIPRGQFIDGRGRSMDQMGQVAGSDETGSRQ